MGIGVNQRAHGQFVVNASPAGNGRPIGSGSIVTSLAAVSARFAPSAP
jgi:hypothetical protein